MKPCLHLPLWFVGACLLAPSARAASPRIEHDPAQHTVTLADAQRHLVLRLNYDGRCVLDRLSVYGRETVAPAAGVGSALKIAGHWYTTRSNLPSPQVEVIRSNVTVRALRFGGGGLEVAEDWTFTVHADRIVWAIDRTYLNAGTVEDTGFPVWEFSDMSTWTGGLLGTGGVAWNPFLDRPHATYGAHTGWVTFWHRDRRDCLRLAPALSPGLQAAVRFSRQPSGALTLHHSVTTEELAPRHALNRFLGDRQDLWAPFSVSPGTLHVEYTLTALDYDAAYGRGEFPGLNGRSIGEVLNTIARVGVVDRRLHGSNNWRLGYAVLHEPWIAQLGLAIDDPLYFAGCAETLDFQRDHAIDADGRVKSRWGYNAGDAIPGTFDAFGYYEAQWGMLMDSQPGYVINVCEQFDFSGDTSWVHRHKSACERALGYLLRRDADADGLLEVLTDSHTAKKSSDWIDVIWASHESAFINAQMFHALNLWSDIEELLGDSAAAANYRQAAAKLQRRFNQTTAEGGFWDAEKGWYVYWRDRDDSVHGNNLVIPVNFMAVAYGLCDDPTRRGALLDKVEALMRQEDLFFWPLCFYPYATDEVHSNQLPFPTYENGDLFLAWGEVGTRAYAAHDPRTALKYIRQVLDRYERDGLVFQRCERKSQRGVGDDILSNNASSVVGLYRNIYGVQPKFNRLYLDPHLTPELNGTRLNYWLRGRRYRLELSVDDYAVTLDGFTLRAARPFAIDVGANALRFYTGKNLAPSLDITPSPAAPLEVRVESWPDTPVGPRAWTTACSQPGVHARQIVSGLPLHSRHTLTANGVSLESLRASGLGQVVFDVSLSPTTPTRLMLVPAP